MIPQTIFVCADGKRMVGTFTGKMNSEGYPIYRFKDTAAVNHADSEIGERVLQPTLTPQYGFYVLCGNWNRLPIFTLQPSVSA